MESLKSKMFDKFEAMEINEMSAAKGGANITQTKTIEGSRAPGLWIEDEVMKQDGKGKSPSLPAKPRL